MFDTVIGGHITLLFTVEKDGRLLRNQGSRGIGFNVDHGVSASVFETKTSQNQIEQKLSAGSSLDGEIIVEDGLKGDLSHVSTDTEVV